MGASGWEYYVPYQEDLGAALDLLRHEVFQAEDYYWDPWDEDLPEGEAKPKPATLEELDPGVATQRSGAVYLVRDAYTEARAPGHACGDRFRSGRRIGRSRDTRMALDTLAALNDLGGGDLDMQRRHFLGTAAYSVAGLALPGGSWWEEMAEQGKSRRPALRSSVSAKDVADVRDLVSFFSHRDQRRGGGHGRTAVVAYLKTEISHYLSCTFPNNQIRRDMFAAAGELAYLSGWMAFDNSQHVIAQRYFTLAVKLAAEAQDRALAAHILRAMAHQAVDLGHGPQALALAEASMDRVRHAAAGPRERALLGVVHARSLAAVGQKKGATAALLLAENDLASATPGIAEPGRVFFFGEASLAHETACTLRDIGDLKGAEHEFARSVRTRKATAFTRTHAVTLGYLGAVQAKVGNIEAACATWSQSLEAMDGVHSGRALGTVVDMRRALSPFRKRGISAVTQLDSRAAEILRTVA